MLSVCYMTSFLRLVLLSTISLVKLSAIKSPCTISDKVLFRSSSTSSYTIYLNYNQVGSPSVGPNPSWYQSPLGLQFLLWMILLHELPALNACPSFASVTSLISVPIGTMLCFNSSIYLQETMHKKAKTSARSAKKGTRKPQVSKRTKKSKK